jgi:type VI secretion system protein ImpA
MDEEGGVPAGMGQVVTLAMKLPGENPAGENLRQDFAANSPYYRLRDLRSEAREIERRLDHDPDADAAPLPKLWRAVQDLAVKALTERTKDLELAVWLTEALVRLEGPAGIGTGATLITALVEGLWDSGLHPLPDEDGLATRIAPITGLNGVSSDGTLMQPLRKSPLFPGPDGLVSYYQYKQSQDMAAISDPAQQKQRLDSGVIPLETLEAAAVKAGAAYFGPLRDTLRHALAAWERMSDVLDAHASDDPPPTGRVRELLRAMLEIAAGFAPDDTIGVAASEDDTAANGTGEPSAAGGAAAPAAAARQVTRDDMLRELVRIAEFFKRTEPQSPLAYTLEEAVRRARLTWPELLAEVVGDEATRNGMLNMLGIRPPAPEPS